MLVFKLISGIIEIDKVSRCVHAYLAEINNLKHPAGKQCIEIQFGSKCNNRQTKALNVQNKVLTLIYPQHAKRVETRTNNFF